MLDISPVAALIVLGVIENLIKVLLFKQLSAMKKLNFLQHASYEEKEVEKNFYKL